MKAFLVWLRNLTAYQQFSLVLASAVISATLIAPVIFYAVEGEIPLGVYVAAAATAAFVASPLIMLFVAIARSLVKSEEKMAIVTRANKRKNAIFRSLLDASVSMQTAHELSDLMDSVLQQLAQLFPSNRFAVIVRSHRADMILHLSASGIDDSEKRILIASHEALMAGDNADVERALRERHEGSRANPTDDIRWYFLPMRASGEQTIGTLVIKGPPLNQESLEIVSIFQDQLSAATATKLLGLELEKLANTDPLTGLFNRTYFQRELDKKIRLKRETPELDFSLLVVDVNGLKEVNDQLGHQSGDDLLTSVARLLTRACRSEDAVCRIGGDEFVILCPGTSTRQAIHLVQRIKERSTLSERNYRTPENRVITIPLSLSIGMACSADTAPEDIYRVADGKMYDDKKAYYQDVANS
ncbi:MAG: GGDEF domain-containing protein [Pseudomonadota bacterium]|nr:GGDEF domain-containing protein [Pseudomonadota bacterium]